MSTVRQSLLVRFFRAFFEVFFKTMREGLVDKVIAVATIVYFFGRGVVTQHWEVIVPLAWGVSAIIVWHGFSAAEAVSKALVQEAEQSAPKGFAAAPVTHTYPVLHKTRLYAMACVLSIICGYASYQVWVWSGRDEPSLVELEKQGRTEFLLVRNQPIEDETFFLVLDRKYSMDELGEFRALLRMQAEFDSNKGLDYLWFSIAKPKIDNIRFGGMPTPFSVQSSVWYDTPPKTLQDMTFGQSNNDKSSSLSTQGNTPRDVGSFKTPEDFDKHTFELYMTRDLLSHVKYIGLRVNSYMLFAFPRRCLASIGVEAPLNDSLWPTPLTASEKRELVQIVSKSYNPPEWEHAGKWWQFNFEYATPLKWGVVRTVKEFWEPKDCP